jgi:beta-1,2-mannosyltransferase
LPFAGFANSGQSGKETCKQLRRESTISVQQSKYLYDDLPQIAAAVGSHPLVVDEYKKYADAPEEEQRKVHKAWARLSGSSVWLPDQQVYFVVTRVLFHERNNIDWPFMSWLRGQLYDEDWNHLDGHSIQWGGQTFTFPTIFNVDADYDRGGIFYGPEDPRIIIEEGVDGAEPVILYNSIKKEFEWNRAMYLYRPFSGTSTVAKFTDSGRRGTEKNWAPFFVPSDDPKSNKRQPNEYLHFVHTFDPLTIARCHLKTGLCEHVYPEAHTDNNDNLMRGGTNFVPIPLPESPTSSNNVQAWAAFPRTTIDKTCGLTRFYRPEFLVMVRINGAFHIAYISAPTDFGNAVIDLTPDEDPCVKGRIMLPNSIAHWDTRPSHDILTLTMSVDDSSVQILRVRGFLDLVLGLPIIQEAIYGQGVLKNETWEDGELMHKKSADLLECSILSARQDAHLTGWQADAERHRVPVHNDKGEVVGYRGDHEKHEEKHEEEEEKGEEKQ